MKTVKFVVASCLILTVICIGVTLYALYHHDIERAWTRRKLPDVETRFDDALEEVSVIAPEHKVLESKITQPYVSHYDIQTYCIYAFATYTYSTLMQPEDLLAAYEAYFTELGYQSLASRLAFLNPERTMVVRVFIKFSDLVRWSIYNTVYEVRIAYSEPSPVDCISLYAVIFDAP